MQVLLGQSHNIGHETFLSGLDEVRRQVRHVHVTPPEREDHLHEGCDYESGQVGVVGGEDHLLLHEDCREDEPEGLGREGEMEDVTDLVQGMGV